MMIEEGCGQRPTEDPARHLPVRSPRPGCENNRVKPPKSLPGKKAYIPAPREQQYVAHTTTNKKEVITNVKEE
jgi:hypothetical protein